MSSISIRQLPKLTAIPRPIQATQKPRQYPQLKTRKQKNNWSIYNVLPAIRERELGDFTKKENELQDNEPTPFSEISDNEFLYNEMTAAWEDMFEREAIMKIIRGKAFIQYLELKSGHMDWVIKMAHNNVWVPVKESGIPKIISMDPSSDGIKMHVPSPPNYPKGSSPNIDNPKPFVPKPPCYPKNRSPTSLGTRNVELELHDDHNDQLGTKLNLENIVSKPTSHPENDLSTRLNSEGSTLKPRDRLIHTNCTKDLSPITGNNKIFAPKPPAERKIKSPIRRSPEAMKFLPTPPAYCRGSNRHSRKVRKADIVKQLPIPSSNLSPISEIPSPRKRQQ